MDHPKTLISHLEELRRRLLIIVLVFVSVTGILIIFPDPFNSYSARLFKAFYSYCVPALQAAGWQLTTGAYFTDPLEPVMVNFKLASFIGLLVTVPVLAWQVFAFAAPAMNGRRGRAVLTYLLFGSVVFFALGLLFSFYLLLPASFTILMKYGASMGLVPMLTAGKFFNLAFWMMLLFSLPFELPLVMWFLSYMGIVSAEKMKKGRKAMWVIIPAFSALVTPDPTLFSMLILSACLILLYELGIIVTGVFKQKKSNKNSLKYKKN